MIPTVITKTDKGERAYDIFSCLLSERIILLTGEIDDNTAETVVAQLLFLEAEDPEKQISLYINSPGGSVTAGLAIYDTMRLVRRQSASDRHVRWVPSFLQEETSGSPLSIQG